MSVQNDGSVDVLERVIDSAASDSEESMEAKKAAYLEHAHDLVQQFYARLTSNYCDVRKGFEDKVGLLTFPNSGTTWTIDLVRQATGIRKHTIYEKELLGVGGEPSRGVLSVNSEEDRLPEYYEPVLVKSHVNKYGYYPVDGICPKDLDAVYAQWQRHLATDYSRHVRLVRNPFDNLRARFRFHNRNHKTRPEFKEYAFADYIREDFRRYLVWHACCDRVVELKPLLTVVYGNLLSNCRFELSRILEFCGFEVDLDRIEAAMAGNPPMYTQENEIPSHLKHFSVEDINWVAGELRTWMEEMDSLG